MYRDSQYGLTIDLSGPDGNAFILLGKVREYAKQLDKDAKAIVEEMMAGDYNDLIAVFAREFGDVITLLNVPESAGVRHDPQPGDDEPLIDGPAAARRCADNSSPCERRRNSDDNTCEHYPDEPFFNDPDYASGGDS